MGLFAEFVDFVSVLGRFAGVLWVFYGRGLLQEDGFEGGGEFRVRGEFFGELSEDSRTVKVAAGAIAGITV